MSSVVLKDLYLEKCVVFIDDTVVFGKTAAEFLSNLEAVFRRLVEYNVRLKPSKCSFGRGRVRGTHI